MSLSGTYASGLPSFEEGCSACPAGYASNVSGATNCSACPQGYHTDGLVGESECSSCPAGTFTTSRGTVQCSQCALDCIGDQSVGGTCNPIDGLCYCKPLYFAADCSERHLIENSMYFAYASLVMIISVVFPITLCSGVLSRLSLQLSNRFQPRKIVDYRSRVERQKKGNQLMALLLLPFLLLSDVAGHLVRILVNAWLLTSSLKALRFKTPEAFEELYHGILGAAVWLNRYIPFIPFPLLAKAFRVMAFWFDRLDQWAAGLLVAAEVTCEGATLPVHLCFNVTMIIFVVVLIESNAELAFGAKARLAFAGSGILRMCAEKANDVVRRTFNTFVQVLVSSVSYSRFLYTDANPICNNQKAAPPFDTLPHDSIVAYASMFLAMVSLPFFCHILLHTFVWGRGPVARDGTWVDGGYYLPPAEDPADIGGKKKDEDEESKAGGESAMEVQDWSASTVGPTRAAVGQPRHVDIEAMGIEQDRDSAISVQAVGLNDSDLQLLYAPDRKKRVRDPGFFLNVWRCGRFYMHKPREYVRCVASKIRILWHLTLGYWDDELVDNLEIRALAARYDGGVHTVDDSWALHQPVLESVGSGHSLFWQFFPLGVFVAKFGEATNHEPCFIPAEKSSEPIEMSKDKQHRLWMWSFDLMEYAALVHFVVVPTPMAFVVIALIVCVHTASSTIPKISDNTFSHWCFQFTRMRRVTQWMLSTPERRAQNKFLNRRFHRSRPRRPEVHQMGDTLEICTRYLGHRVRNERFEVMVHPPVRKAPSPMPCSGCILVKNIDPKRFESYRVRVGWESVGTIGCFSEPRRFFVRPDVPPYTPAVPGVYDLPDDISKLVVHVSLCKSPGKVIGLHDFRSFLLSRVSSFLNPDDNLMLRDMVSISVSQACRAMAKFICRIEDENGEPIYPLRRSMAPGGVIELDDRFTPGTTCQVRIALLSPMGTPTSWSDAVKVQIGAHKIITTARTRLEASLRKGTPKEWSAAIMKAIDTWDRVKHATAPQQFQFIATVELRRAIKKAQRELSHAQEHALMASPIAQTNRWTTTLPFSCWQGVTLNDMQLVKELDGSAGQSGDGNGRTTSPRRRFGRQGRSNEAVQRGFLIQRNLADLKPLFVASLQRLKLVSASNIRGSLSTLRFAVNLKTLELSGTLISGDLQTFLCLGALEVLALEDTRVAGSIADLRRCTSLKVLRLSGTKVNGTIRVLEHMPGIKELALSLTSVDGAITVLNKCRELHKVSLAMTNVHGDVEVFKSLPYIEEVLVSGTQIYGSLTSFYSCNKLVELDVMECPHLFGDLRAAREALRHLMRFQCSPSLSPEVRETFLIDEEAMSAGGFTGVPESKSQDNDQDSGCVLIEINTPVDFGEEVEISVPQPSEASRAGSASEREYKSKMAMENLQQGIRLLYGKGMDKNERLGLQFLRKAALAGVAEAQYRMGRALLLGVGAPQDDYRAFRAFEMAAKQRFPAAFTDLGLLYEQGRGCNRASVALAFTMFERGVKHDEIRAFYHLGRFFAFGLHAKKDRQRALQLLAVAARKGHSGAVSMVRDSWLWRKLPDDRYSSTLRQLSLPPEAPRRRVSLLGAVSSPTSSNPASSRPGQANLGASPDRAATKAAISRQIDLDNLVQNLPPGQAGADEESKTDSGSSALVDTDSESEDNVIPSLRRSISMDGVNVMEKVEQKLHRPEHRIGLVVEVHHADSIVIQDPRLSLGQTNILFGPDMYMRARISGFDNFKNTYELDYMDGPFYNDEDPNDQVHQFSRNMFLTNVKPDSVRANLMDMMKRPPYFSVLISLVQIAYFVYYVASQRDTVTSMQPLAGDPALFFKLVGDPSSPYDSNTDFPRCDDLRPEFWRFFSYQLVHKGWLHLATNVFLQLLLGVPIEMVHGTRRVAFLYQFGVYLGAVNVASVVPATTVVGASGGVYAIIGVHWANLLMNWNEMRHGFFRNYLVLFILSLILFGTIYDSGLANGGLDDDTSHAAHAGGFIAGFVCGVFALKNAKSEWYERRIIVPMAVAVFLVLGVYGSFWVFNPANFPPEANPFLARYTPNWHTGDSCCWQALRCGGLQQSHYGDFTCHVDGSKGILHFNDEPVDSCSSLVNYASLEA